MTPGGAAGERLAVPLVITLLGLLALRLALVGGVAAQGIGLHVDEAQYWYWSRELQWGYYSKPPVIAALIAASTALFGNGPLGLRVLAMACYPLTAGVLFVLGRAMGGARVGYTAALLFIASPLAGVLGSAATTDAPLLLAWSLALLAWWRVLQRPAAWGPVLGFGLACGCGLLSKYTMAAMLPTALWLWWLCPHADGRRDARVLRGWLVACVIALLVLSPNLLWNASHGWPTLQHTAEITAEAPRRSGEGALGSGLVFLLAQWVVAGPLLLLYARPLLRGVRGAWRGGEGDEHRALRYTLGSLLPLLAVGTLQAFRSQAEINWVAPIHLGLFLALGLAAQALWPLAAQRRRLQWVVAGQVVLVSLLVGLPLLRPGQPLPPALDLWGRMRGWPEAYAALHGQAAGAHAAGARTVVGTSRAVLAQAAYAWRDLGLRYVAWNPQGTVHSHFEMPGRWPAGVPAGEPLLLLTERDWPPALQAAVQGFQPLGAVRVELGRRAPVQLRLAQARREEGGAAAPGARP